MPQQRGSQNDLFAPPSKQELESSSLFAPPTEEELSGSRQAKIPEERGFGETILEDYVVPVGREIDRYTGAPTRAALNEVVEGRGLLSGASKFTSQFGEEPELAPTGKEIATKLGANNKTELSSVLPEMYSDTGEEWLKLKRHGMLDPTAAGAAGLGIDIVADPTNLIPVGAIAKGGAKLAKAGLKAGVEGGVAVGKSLLKGAAKAADVATATSAGSKGLALAESAAEQIGRAGESLKGLVTTTPKAKAAKNLEVAIKHGINPEILPSTAKYKGLLPRLEQAKAMGVGGDELLKANQEVFSQFDNAVDNVIENIGGVHDPVAAGEVIKSGYEKAVNELFDQNPVRYSNLHKVAPGIELTEKASADLASKLNGVEKQMKGYMVRGTSEQKAMAKDVLSQINSIRSSKNVKQLTEQIGEVGKLGHAPSSSFKLPIDQKSFRDIYSAMGDAILTSADEVVPDAAKELRTFNKESTEFLRNIEPIQKALQSKTIAPESLFKSLTSDSKRLESLFKMLDPESQRSMKGAILSSIVKAGAGDQVQIGRTINALKEAKPRLMKVFSSAELSEIEELLELGLEMGPRASPYIPQTGVTGLFRDLKQRIPEAIADDQVLQYLKNKAPKITSAASDLAPSVNITEGLLELPTKKSLSQGLINMQKKRMPIGGLLKGAQSIAPSQYEYPERR